MIAQRNKPTKLTALLGALAAAMAMLAIAAPVSALAAPVLDLELSHQPDSGLASGGHGIYAIRVSNTGTSGTTSPVTAKFEVPAGSGLQITAVTDEINKKLFHGQLPFWDCAIAGDGLSVSCVGPEVEGFQLPIGPGEEACQEFTEEELGEAFPCRILVTVAVDPDLGRGLVTPSATACGGGASTCPAAADSATDPTPTWLPFDVVNFEASVIDEGSGPFTQAGGHPFEAINTIDFTRSFDGLGNAISGGSIEDASVELPAGLVGDPTAYPQCQETQISTNNCPGDTQIGTVDITASDGSKTGRYPVYNLVPPFGQPAEFGFNIDNIIWVHVTAHVSPDGRITLTVSKATQFVPIAGSEFRFWGVPADPSHDAERECHPKSCPSGVVPPKPFVSLPTSCTGPLPWNLHANSWQHPEAVIEASVETPGTDGCNALDYTGPRAPSIQARPTTNAADSPAGLDVDVHTPQNADPNGTAEAHLKDAILTLPEGLVLNPAAANGLGACSPAEIGIDATSGDPNEDPPACPDASKLGTVTVDTPLVGHPLPGAIYQATPYDNPFHSLLALYIVIDDVQSGTLLKLAGKVNLDQTTGQISTSFEENPQLPFEHFHVHLKSGAGAPLRTPATCGTYTTTSSLTPWSAPDSGPPAHPADSWAIARGANGGACPANENALPNAPSLDAGTVSPIAAAYSPLVVNLRREDGTQQFRSVTLTPPQGLVGKLAGIPYCPQPALDAAAAKSGRGEEASPSCPAASYVGSVTAAAGAGPAPYYAPGKAYLTGPYKGAPLSLAIVTPATAGPFDLGTIVVRTALYVDSKTAQITAVSDPIPTILQGIPLDVRSVSVRMDRPDFTINPTSCDPMSFGGSLLTTLGQTAPLSNRFQVGECGRLGFKPQLKLSLKGATKRGKYPALTAVLQMPAANANLAAISVALPHSEFLAQEHIRTVCTRVQFAADACPPEAIYGTATVTTPLLDYPLSGPVYLRSSDNLLPDLVPDLRGPTGQPIKLEAAGRTDSIHGGIRNSFDFVPDAPFTKLVLQLEGGKKGLLVNSRDICKQVNKATVKYAAHNGLSVEAHPVLKADCPKKAKKHHKRRAARHGAR